MTQYRMFDKKELDYVEGLIWEIEDDVLKFLKDTMSPHYWINYTIHVLELKNSNVVSLHQLNVCSQISLYPMTY